jgi:hypothetical protein
VARELLALLSTAMTSLPPPNVVVGVAAERTSIAGNRDFYRIVWVHDSVRNRFKSLTLLSMC